MFSRVSSDGAKSPLFSFPRVVNNNAARIVACGVIFLALGFLVSRWPGFLLLLVAGFAARVAAGPRFSPLAKFASSKWLLSKGLPYDPVPGPPKRFAQSIGLVMSALAFIFTMFDFHNAAMVAISFLLVAALLEAALGFCLGCWLFSLLMRAGVVPKEVCVECADISSRISTSRRAM